MMRMGLLAVVTGVMLSASYDRAAIAAEAVSEKPLPGFEIGPPMDRVVPGEVLVDPPTVENLGFRWYIRGDSNRNASVGVAYREVGQTAWRDGLPMLRVQHEVANE